MKNLHNNPLILILIFICFTTQLHAQEDTTSVEPELVVYRFTVDDILNSDLMVTTASKKEENQFEAPGVITVITAKEIEKFGGNNLWEVFERIPHIQPHSNPAMFKRSLLFRKEVGFGKILPLIDGRPLRDSQWATTFRFLNSFPLERVERIEFVRGPGSVMYGTFAMNGVVNIVT